MSDNNLSNIKDIKQLKNPLNNYISHDIDDIQNKIFNYILHKIDNLLQLKNIHYNNKLADNIDKLNKILK